MTRKIDLSPRIPMVREGGAPNTETLIVMQQIAAMLREIEASVEALEARVAALEVFHP